MPSVSQTPSDQTGTDEPSASRRNPDTIDVRKARLAELVAGLTGCAPSGALHVLRTRDDGASGDALEVVARAMVDVDRPPPEGFRVAGFLRDDEDDPDREGARYDGHLDSSGDGNLGLDGFDEDVDHRFE
jgi:hypothetical protein